MKTFLYPGPLPLAFSYLECLFLLIQLWEIWKHPYNRRQWWYVVLLLLLLFFNFANGSPLHDRLQYILAYGAAYLLGAYFPFYFYKNFRLEALRFHATWGVSLFLLLPYLLFYVFLYLINGQLIADREWGVVLPAIYGLVVLRAIYRAIRLRRLQDKSWWGYCEALTVWMAILPWEAMSLFAFYPVPQVVEIVIGNLGWLAVTFFMMARAARSQQARHRHYQQLLADSLRKLGDKQQQFQKMCKHYHYTNRQARIVLYLCEGLSYQAIGEKLHLGRSSVDNRVQEIYRKTKVHSRVELIRKLGLSDISGVKPPD